MLNFLKKAYAEILKTELTFEIVWISLLPTFSYRSERMQSLEPHVMEVISIWNDVE